MREPRVILTDGKDAITLTVKELRPETVVMLITDALDLCDKLTDGKVKAQDIANRL